MARSRTSKQPHLKTQERTEEQAKVDALNWLVRQLSWEQSLSTLRGDPAPKSRSRSRAPKPTPKAA
jgi:hypothetical protein